MTEDTSLVVQEQEALAVPDPALFLMPALQVAQAVERFKMFKQIVAQLMIEGEDYGTLPGTKQHMLYKPGAEKLSTFFGLQINLQRQSAIEDWEKGFFHYVYKADVWRGTMKIVSCERSCNSKEAKYAYIWVETGKKPNKEDEAQAKANKTGKWTQYGKWMERRPNPNPWDLVNTIQAMAQKRAYVGAVLLAVNASGFFSKKVEITDADDVEVDSDFDEQPKQTKKTNGKQENGEVDSTAFWVAVRDAGIKQVDAKPLADRVTKGEMTWADAIAQLPQ